MLDQLLNGQLIASEKNNEKDLFSHWKAYTFHKLSPPDISIKFSAESISIEGIFVAGYQSALHALFPDKDWQGWSSFLFSEQPDENEKMLPTTLKKDGVVYFLSGSKSWVANSEYVGRLIVTLKPGNDNPEDSGGVIIRDKDIGVSVNNYKSVKFLNNISQGWAIFDRVKVEDNQFFEKSLIREFKKVESDYMILSILSFFLSKKFSIGKKPEDNLKSICSDYYWYLKKSESEPWRKSSSLRVRAKEYILENIEDNVTSTVDWDKDKRLFHMYL